MSSLGIAKVNAALSCGFKALNQFSSLRLPRKFILMCIRVLAVSRIRVSSLRAISSPTRGRRRVAT